MGMEANSASGALLQSKESGENKGLVCVRFSVVLRCPGRITKQHFHLGYLTTRVQRTVKSTSDHSYSRFQPESHGFSYASTRYHLIAGGGLPCHDC